jgi:pantoate ligase/cytidylate kinase
MYRAVTWLLQRLALPIAETEQLVQVLADLNLRLEAQPQADQLVWVNGENITEQIRSAEITEAVSAVAALPSVRSALTSQQRRFGARGGLVAEGRDIGTAVFPQAELKVFLTATVAERARRRSADLAARGLPVPELIQLEQEIAHRDQLDSSREIAPLCQAPDALELISDGLTIKQVADQIISWYHQRLADLHDEGP